MILWILVLGFVAVMAAVRLLPSDPARWHKQAYPSGLGEIPSKRGFVWRKELQDDGTGLLQAFDDVVMQTPRSTRFAGSVAEGQTTYITRSRVFGFPDYTTIGIYQGLKEDVDVRYIEINARLRFGKSDLGVNAKRVKGWLAAVQ